MAISMANMGVVHVGGEARRLGDSCIPGMGQDHLRVQRNTWPIPGMQECPQPELHPANMDVAINWKTQSTMAMTMVGKKTLWSLSGLALLLP